MSKSNKWDIMGEKGSKKKVMDKRIQKPESERTIAHTHTSSRWCLGRNKQERDKREYIGQTSHGLVAWLVGWLVGLILVFDSPPHNSKN
jgi:hypothetical protein